MEGTGKAVRWRIERADGAPFALAGIWERRLNDEGPAHWSFAMLTINADDHPLMKRFHKPGEDMRSVVVLEPEDYEPWLQARTEVEARSSLQPFDSEAMVAVSAPVTRTKKRPANRAFLMKQSTFRPQSSGTAHFPCG